MKRFDCRRCGAELFLENVRCERCGTPQGFSRAEAGFVPLQDGEIAWTDDAGTPWYRCADEQLAACGWLADAPGALCPACRFTRRRPADDDAGGLAGFQQAEAAKRRLLVELDHRGITLVDRLADPDRGLAFDMLSSEHEDVTTGHADGIITLDLAETAPDHRARMRVSLAEPYRTVLGHLRHEVGHHVQWRLVTGGALLERCRELFGDETADYAAALERHYQQGPPADWQQHHISQYATMHPFEDFAETFAHHLHITETIGTAVAQGLVEAPVTAGFGELVQQVWLPLSGALNQITRAMGLPDLYPFVIPPAVVDKLEFVAALRDPAPDDRG